MTPVTWLAASLPDDGGLRSPAHRLGRRAARHHQHELHDEPGTRASALERRRRWLEIAQGAWAEYPQSRLGVPLDQSMAAMRPHG